MGNKSKHWASKVNGWVFLSHSSEDYEQVKVIRDYLELNNFNAIMFYLHSFNDVSKVKQVEDLILNEIDARNIFVSCNSHNADSSKWVQLEKNHVRHKRNIIKVDIDLEVLKNRRCSELSKLDNLMINSSIYILAPSNETRIQDTITFLSQKGFKIYEVDEIKHAKRQKRLDLFQSAVNEVKETNSTLIVFVHDNLKWQEEVNKMMYQDEYSRDNVIVVDLTEPLKENSFHRIHNYTNIVHLYEFDNSFDEYLQVLEERIWRNIHDN